MARTHAGLSERGIQLMLIEEEVELQAERCWRVGLIVSELITNAMRHAFAHTCGPDPQIVVELSAAGGGVRVRVSDNGVAVRRATSGSGSGTKIVDALAADLGGYMQRDFGDAGASVLLWIPA